MEHENSDDQLIWFDNYLNTLTDNDDSDLRVGLVKLLKNKGLNFLQKCVLNNRIEDNYFAESKYSISFTLGLWEDIEFNSDSITEFNFYESMKNLFNEENQESKFIIDIAISNSQKYAELLLNNLNFCDIFHNKIDHTTIKLYNLEEIRKYLMALKNPEDNKILDLILNNIFQYEQYETKNFMGNSDSFGLFDGLLKLRLKSAQIFMNKKENEKINEYKEKLFEKLIDNSIFFKKFEVIRVNFNCFI